MQNPPPPPPPPGQPPMMPPGQPPIYPTGGAMSVPGNLASPGLRIVGGLIDVVILVVVVAIVDFILRDNRGPTGLIGLIIWVGYLAYFWNSRGQSIGMMVFGFRVRDVQTGQYPEIGKSIVRGLVWTLEVWFTWCIVGAIGWLWQLWDPQRQAIHDKIAGTIVTIN